MPLDPNTSKKRIRNFEKFGGYNPYFNEEKSEKVDKISLPKRNRNANSYVGNRPQSKSRKTRTRAFIKTLNRRKAKNARK
jgi:hypothetical protein